MVVEATVSPDLCRKIQVATNLNKHLSPMFDIISAPVAWEIFSCALDAGLFDAVSTASTSAEVADRHEFNPLVCERMLEALVSLGFLRKDGTQFVLKNNYQAYLCRDSDQSLADVINYLARRSHRGLEALQDALSGDVPLSESANGNCREPNWDEVCAEISDYQKVLAADWAKQIVTSLPGFGSCTSLLDLASGPGFCGMRIASANPSLRVTLFDLPRTIEFARSKVHDAGLEGQVRLIAGDYNTDNIGDNYNIIWASLCFYFAKPSLMHLLAKLHSSLSPGGRLISFHEGVDKSLENQSQVVRRFMPSLWSSHKIFENGEIASALRATGFRHVESSLVNTAIGCIEITVGKK